MESVGIPKIFKAVSEETVKNNKIYIKGLEMEALAFYLSKASGKGLKAAENFLAIKEAVDGGYSLREADNKRERNLQMRIEAIRNGIDNEPIQAVEETTVED